MEEWIPILGILTGIIIPLGVFTWLYLDEKNKRAAIIEVSKNISDPVKVEELFNALTEKDKEPIDYRRSGVITLFVGIGLFLLGLFALGPVLEGVGLLVGSIGVGTMIAGYLFPNDSIHLSKAVEKFEEK
jgi:polyferredoxin